MNNMTSALLKTVATLVGIFCLFLIIFLAEKYFWFAVIVLAVCSALFVLLIFLSFYIAECDKDNR